jgi:tRNA/tmRNA/rRNA uracil-C5-methylase (TrmA/RlmC/RlmD family)
MIPSHLDLSVEKPAAGGRMVARHEGQIVLVAGAIPGERVHARVERASKGVIFATTVDVLSPSSDRRSFYGDLLCGGNVYAHITYARQLEIKAAVIADAFARIARVPLPTVRSPESGARSPGSEVRSPKSEVRAGTVHVTGSEERGYRMRARLHVRDGRIGFYREGTHDLCDPAATGQLLPQTLEVLHRCETALRHERVTGVTSLELSENMPGDERALHFEIDRAVDLSRVADETGPGLTGLGYSGPFSGAPAVVFGTPVVSDRVLVVTKVGEHAMTLQRNVCAFFQGNRYLLPMLLSRVVSRVDAGPVIDLYAGVGLFGVALAACGRSGVTAVEGDRVSAQDLKANAAPYGSAIETVHQPVEGFLATRRASPDATLIVDPPRTGMSREALAGVVALGARAVVYVSCDMATLARDVRRLVDAGYVMEHVEGFDLFPNTAHVEAVVKMRKVRAQD